MERRNLVDRHAQVGLFAIASLVLLRLVIGWHFFTQGVEKVGYNPSKGGYGLVFSAEPFLSQAKGPLAGLFHLQVPNGHDWRALLAIPRQSEVLASDKAAEQEKWLADYERRRTEAGKKKEPVPVEFPPFAPYLDWATKIVGDWNGLLAKGVAVKGLAEEQRTAMAEVFALRQEQLADYLSSEAEAISDWQHELWRLDKWRSLPEAEKVPFLQKRIGKKKAETSSTPLAWVKQVEAFEQGLNDDLRGLLTAEQAADASNSVAISDALTSPRRSWLNFVNLAVTTLVMGVGICLLLGLFTPVAAVAGALFLLAIVATQPPWVADAEPTIYQSVELAGLLVLAATGAGRWLGLDYFCHALCSRRSGGNR